jgi:hypothetical protein
MTKKPYRPGAGVWTGIVVGAFIGLLLDKFALGGIFGFFVGIMIDSSRRRAANAANAAESADAANPATPPTPSVTNPTPGPEGT